MFLIQLIGIKFMDVSNSKNNISSKGRVYYGNNLAREYAPQYRDIIHQLKHHTANKDLTHNVYINKSQGSKAFSMNIITSYKHPRKVGGVDEHVLEQGYSGIDFRKGKKYLLKQIKKIPSWKSNIDLTLSHDVPDIDIKPVKKSFFDKIKKIFRF